MSKCKRCNRELKTQHESGMGHVCRIKAERDTAIAQSQKPRVEALFIRRPSRRSYLVITKPRFIVVVNENENGRFAECRCSEKSKCEHIELVAEVDNRKFPPETKISLHGDKSHLFAEV